MTSNVKVESGLQLLARLIKKPHLENFYPVLFDNGLTGGHIVEIYSKYSTNCLLGELISESLIPVELGGPGASIVLFNTDGNLNLDYVINFCKNKFKQKKPKCSESDIETLLSCVLKNCYFFNIYDETQFYVSIQKLENVLNDNSNISMVVFDTLTAFYWCEQSFKITKMDSYIKKLLHALQKVTKDYNIVLLYGRSEHFSSNKEPIEKLDMDEALNYRIQIVYNDIGPNYVNVRTHNTQFKKEFNLKEDELCWL